MKSTFTKVAAVAASAALAASGATGIANAQEETGSLSAESLGGGSAELSSGSAGENFGSIILEADATGQGSLDTSGSAISEPTTGSLSGSVSAAVGSVNPITPAEGTGSVDTSGSIIGEPTTGSLAPVYAPIAGSLGIGEGATTVLGSDGGSLGPAIMVGGSVAAVTAGIHFAPQIHQGLTDMGVQLPPLPGQFLPPAPAPQNDAAPGPGTPNGRG